MIAARFIVSPYAVASVSVTNPRCETSSLDLSRVRGFRKKADRDTGLVAARARIELAESGLRASHYA
jgi:hypothetical protein